MEPTVWVFGGSDGVKDVAPILGEFSVRYYAIVIKGVGEPQQVQSKTITQIVDELKKRPDIIFICVDTSLRLLERYCQLLRSCEASLPQTKLYCVVNNSTMHRDFVSSHSVAKEQVITAKEIADRLQALEATKRESSEPNCKPERKILLRDFLFQAKPPPTSAQYFIMSLLFPAVIVLILAVFAPQLLEGLKVTFMTRPEYERLQVEIEKRQVELKGLKQQVSKMEETRKETQRELSQLQHDKRELEQQKKDLEFGKKRLIEQKTDLEAQKTRLEETVKKLEDQRTRIQHILNDPTV